MSKFVSPFRTASKYTLVQPEATQHACYNKTITKRSSPFPQKRSWWNIAGMRNRKSTDKKSWRFTQTKKKDLTLKMWRSSRQHLQKLHMSGCEHCFYISQSKIKMNILSVRGHMYVMPSLGGTTIPCHNWMGNSVTAGHRCHWREMVLHNAHVYKSWSWILVFKLKQSTQDMIQEVVKRLSLFFCPRLSSALSFQNIMYPQLAQSTILTDSGVSRLKL